MRLVLATRNPGKVAEMRALLVGLPVEVISAAEIDRAPEVEETAPTLEANARLKAVALAEHTGLPALADDTGLEVYALGGRPGARSARYGGEEGDDAANRARLLDELHRGDDRSARFRTVLALAAGGTLQFFEGVCEGRITAEERGDGGFGYDPIFVPAGDTRTFAEMPPEDKNAVSHRRKAIDAFAQYMREVLREVEG